MSDIKVVDIYGSPVNTEDITFKSFPVSCDTMTDLKEKALQVFADAPYTFVGKHDEWNYSIILATMKKMRERIFNNKSEILLEWDFCIGRSEDQTILIAAQLHPEYRPEELLYIVQTMGLIFCYEGVGKGDGSPLP